MGALSLGFLVLLPHVYPVVAIMEPFWVVPELKEKLCIGDLSPLFLLFTEKV
jgi:hypothetical protein